MYNYIKKPFTVHSITTGMEFCIILTTHGYLYSFGDNTHGELGIGQIPSK